jgi:integrase/recombinase XerD
MKIAGHGQAKILSAVEIEQLFADGFTSCRDRTLFGVCLYTACRIAEACSMLQADVYNDTKVVQTHILIRKQNTKGKMSTRSMLTHPRLRGLLTSYSPFTGKIYLFPGRWGRGHIHPKAADKLLRSACLRVGLVGVSTHSFRRTALTTMASAGIPLRVIQEISGHRSLTALQRYLEVTDEQVSAAINALKF